METAVPKQRGGGAFCIAPGCTNGFYTAKKSGKNVHFHQLPKKAELSRRWLAALKRKHPPSGPIQRICSEHFRVTDYVVRGSFAEDGSFVQKTTSKLKPDAVPSVFDFSSYSVGQTDRPTAALSTSALQRKDRAQRRTCAAEEQEVMPMSSYITDIAYDIQFLLEGL